MTSTIHHTNILFLLVCFQSCLVSTLFAFNNNSFFQQTTTTTITITKSVPVVLKSSSNDENGEDGSTSSNTSSSSSSSSSKLQGIVSANTIYFDIEIAGTEIGRLVFHLANPSPLPLHTENIIQLTKGSRKGIDPLTHYVGCEFDFTPASVEDGSGRYRWGHQLKGRGRNAVGRADQILNDPENQLRSTHTCFGGQYYGIKYYEQEELATTDNDIDDDPGVLLTVPLGGPGRGTSKFSIVRVGESPKEWGERLLMNSGVIGRLDPSTLNVLHTMARQRVGPPTIIGSGVIE